MSKKEKDEKIYFKVGMPEEMVQAFLAWIVDAGGKYEQLRVKDLSLPDPDLATLNQPISMGELRLAITEYLKEFWPNQDNLDKRVSRLIGKLTILGAIEDLEGVKIQVHTMESSEDGHYAIDHEVIFKILNHAWISNYPNHLRQYSNLGQDRYKQIRESLKLLLLKRQNGVAYEPPVTVEELYSIKAITLSELAGFMATHEIPDSEITHMVMTLRYSSWLTQGSYGVYNQTMKRDNSEELEESIVEAILATTEERQMNIYLQGMLKKRLYLDNFSKVNFNLLKQMLEMMLKK